MLAIYLGAIPTAFAYLLYVYGLRYVTATISVFLGLAEPATAALLAAALFGERLTLAGWIGAILLLLGLIDLGRSISGTAPLT